MNPNVGDLVRIAESVRIEQPATPGLVDFRPLKEGARRLLPLGHPLRESLLREADALPRDAGLAKLDTYVRWMLALWTA